MPRYLITFLLCVFSLSAFAQVVAIETDDSKSEIFYKWVANSITVAAQGCSAKGIIIECDNGKVENKGDGHYTIAPDTLGECNLVIKKKVGKAIHTIYKKRYKVCELPNPDAFYAGKKGGSLSVAVARNQIAPSASSTGEYGCGKFQIDSCTVIIVRNEKVVFSQVLYNPDGVRFTDERTVEAFFKTLIDGDKLIFAGITCKGPDRKSRHLQAMEFTLIMP
jgi:hypothetical protein